MFKKFNNFGLIKVIRLPSEKHTFINLMFSRDAKYA